MKLQIVSDLHGNQDRWASRYLPYIHPDADVLIIAGDSVDRNTLLTNKFISWLESIAIPIIFILGNHEYDHFLHVDEVVKMYKKILPRFNKNLHVLENDSVIINGYAFLGCTLFTNLSPLGEAKLRNFLNSEHMPLGLTGSWWNAKFQESKEFIFSNLSNPGQKTIVVTHCGPSYNSCNEKYYGMASNEYFFSNLDQLILDHKPTLWVHGHTHSSSDYILGSTRIICNPHGYTFSFGPENLFGFNPQLLVEV